MRKPLHASSLHLALAIALLAAPFAAPAQISVPVDVAGIKDLLSAAVGPGNLQLNGAAGAKRMHVVMLCDIDANELGKLFTDGMPGSPSSSPC